MPVEYQVIIIFVAVNKYLLDVPVAKIVDFEKEFFEYIRTKIPEVPASIKDTKVISDDAEAKLRKAIEDFKADFVK